MGGTPLPPFTDFFFSEKGVTDLGGTPAPPFTDKIRKVVFDGFLYGTTVINTISHEMHVQQDAGGYCYISPFMVEEHPRYIIIGENEAFCVK